MNHIIALGGGGFSMEPANPLLDQYVLAQARAQAGKQRPAVCFVPTASGDAADYVVNFYAAFARLECQPSHLPLINPTTAGLESFLLAQDVIYVGGGNTKSMLAIWREWGVDRILRAAWERGIVLAGISAGANCWFEQCVTDSVPGRLAMLPGLGFLADSICPHYDGEAERRPAYQRLLAQGDILPGYGVEDGVALHFVGQQLQRVVSSRPRARAYALAVASGAVSEQPLQVDYLGAAA